MKYLKSVSAAFLLLLYGPGGVATAGDLQQLHGEITAEFPAVPHLSAHQLETMLARPENDNLVVFDVRQPQEYAVSHLDNAILVDPEISATEFLARFRDRIEGKEVVLYCSVGYRSSDLAQRLLRHQNPTPGLIQRLFGRAPTPTAEPAATDALPTRIYNLEHGIFGWHNAERPLFRGGDTSDQVHPHSPRWATYIERQHGISYD